MKKEKNKKKIREGFSPESLMMSYGYDPKLAEGSIKSPIYQTSTFEFETAEEGKSFFDHIYGEKKLKKKSKKGLIYSRLNNPNLEVLEKRLCLWDKAEDCAVFESGMAAISTVFLECLKPGDLLLSSSPIYGGTNSFIKKFLSEFGIHHLSFKAGMKKAEIEKLIEKSGLAKKLTMIYVETPANPTNDVVDIAMCSQIARKFSSKKRKVRIAVDNTYLGPLWQNPILQGADYVLYSATKYIVGHSDVIAGACMGSEELIQKIKSRRILLGNMASPWTAWLLTRSLETLKARMEIQALNAKKVAEFLNKHPMVEKVYYLGFARKENPLAKKLYKKQYFSDGAMIAFDVKGGQKNAYKFLNQLKLVKLAVSLGSTESLAQHPATMTHRDVSPKDKKSMAITPKLIRLSIGIENYKDLIADLNQALKIK